MGAQATSDHEVLTDAELAAECKLDKKLVQKLCRSGKIRAFKAGDLWRITRAAAEEFKGEVAS